MSLLIEPLEALQELYTAHETDDFPALARETFKAQISSSIKVRLRRARGEHARTLSVRAQAHMIAGNPFAQLLVVSRSAEAQTCTCPV